MLDMMMITQYFDTIRDVGANDKSHTVFVPHGVGAIGDIAAQIRDGVMHANAVQSMKR